MTTSTRHLLTLVSLLIPAALSHGATTVPFLTPGQAIAKMTLPDGFKVNAWAAEPDITQPFAFTFDDRGRIWVLENLNYQTRQSDTFKDGPQGRILILEDTNGDGQADKRSVFADKIFFPTGIALGFGGVWVGSPPNLLFIPDRNGDDIPDSTPEVVLDGWGRNDRHETLNSFTWGPDGWLYGLHGVFTHSNVGQPGTPEEQRHPINAGVWRYHPAKKSFEVFAWGTSNPWGLDFNEHGQMFLTACVIPHLWHIQQGGRYQRQAGNHFNPYIYDDIKTIADHRHKSAHGGARFYLAGQFPPQYRGRLFMCNIHDHAVLTDILKPQGSGYAGHHGDTFLDSHDPQWLGFNMELGPDAAIYIIDWHDADICGNKVVHGETGRIWRLSYNTPGTPRFNLASQSDADLVRLQSHPNNWHVRQSRRILQERATTGKLAPQTLPSLRQLLEQGSSTQLKLQALWALHVTGGTGETLLHGLLSHNDQHLRAWAIQLLAEDQAPSAASLGLWAEMAVNDPSPVVRLYLASAMQRVQPARRWDVLTGLAGHAADKEDQNLPLLIWYALEPAIALDKAAALKMAPKIKIPQLATFFARRIAEREPLKPVKAQPAASVSKDNLIVWLQATGVVTSDDGRVSQWTDGLRNGQHAVQPNPEARPQLIEDIAGRPALRFDGKDDHLVLPDHPRLNFKRSDSFSVSIWVHLDGLQNGWRSIVCKSRDQAPWYGAWIDPSGKWTFGASNANLAGPKAKTGWHHIAIVQDGPSQERTLYVDGFLTGRDSAREASGPGDFWIAGAKSTEEFFKGSISEIQIHQRPLSPSEVAFLAR